MASRAAEFIGRIERTWGIETSQYPQERKSTETPLVAASESGQAQTGLRTGVAGANQELQRQRKSKSLESLTIQGDSPVDDFVSPPLCLAYQSSTGPVKPRVKQGGPPSKAKYYITTDSGQVGRLNDEKHPH